MSCVESPSWILGGQDFLYRQEVHLAYTTLHINGNLWVETRTVGVESDKKKTVNHSETHQNLINRVIIKLSFIMSSVGQTYLCDISKGR